MANVLVLKSSINGETSLTNQLINEFIAARQAAGRHDRIREHDLSAMALPTLDGALFAALRGAADPRPAIRAAVALSDQFIAELKASDLLVIGAPMYNLNVPTDLKKWFDLVARARETFRYTDSWPQGLVEGVRAVVVSSRGGVHQGETTDAVTPYLRAVLGLMGIHEVEFIYAEGLDNRPPGRR
ncbi:FMN-dependent NADH-azoreductase [Klebsiella quasipneumoniae]|uniref:FMN-dependent NADH-azoreductase n=1 Tax=Klebsiella quasipneumoniae TaxID=1463165 RepID=UPI000A0EFBAD|nr:NAD(P)H-dependent oxidoreductase [Klebsiella quasipneumoniae]SMG73417.1 FMN-dependent NADH-azoreductase [Klebsiella quasipneumoniae]